MNPMQTALFNSLFLVLTTVAKRTHVGRVGDIMNYSNARLDDRRQAQADDTLGGSLRLYRAYITTVALQSGVCSVVSFFNHFHAGCMRGAYIVDLRSGGPYCLTYILCA